MEWPIERLEIRTMASGDDSLLLSDRVDWDSFPAYAGEIVRLLGGAVVDRVDGPDQRLWTVSIANQLFWLTYEDSPPGVSLDPQNRDASAMVPGIRQTLWNAVRSRGGTGV